MLHKLNCENIRTGDIALTQKNDFPSTLISYFTLSNCQHSAICAWIDGNVYRSTKKIKFIVRNRGDDILTLAHVTKRRQFDRFTNKKKRGLVLLNWDDYKSDLLMTLWIRPLSKEIPDNSAVACFRKFIQLNSPLMEYEHDYKSILGVSVGIPHRPYEHRLVCTTMVCEYLKESYGYPFMLNKNGIYFDEPCEIPDKVDFILPSREIEVYRSFDFMPEYNQSPVFEDSIHVAYGTSENESYIFKHPFTSLMICIIFFYVISVQGYFLSKRMLFNLHIKECFINFTKILSFIVGMPGGILFLLLFVLSIYSLFVISFNREKDYENVLEKDFSKMKNLQPLNK